jgi:putative NIF3 family GTP cyclohydrolase 1 type 2
MSDNLCHGRVTATFESKESEGYMKAAEVLHHFQQIGSWVNWNNSCDRFLHGDPQTEVAGIATGWIPTNEAIKSAHAKGLNLFVTHEDAFARRYEGTRSGDEMIHQKKRLLDECAMVVVRCHDTWDRMPEYGIPDAWATCLGFATEDRPVESFYKVCRVPSLNLAETARAVLEKVRPLGQDTVLVLGDESRKVNRLAVGTGAITHLPTMRDLGVDAILATDDGMNSWDGALWALDLGVPILVVNHATAEKPGMQAMVDYLNGQFPDVPAEYVDVALPFKSVH